MSLTDAPPRRKRRRLEFHDLRVADIERLCDDAVAVTFDVPPELADAYDFAPGQYLTLCRTVDGQKERRSYSICASAGSRPRVGVREVPDGMFSQWLVHEVRAGDVIEVGTPLGSFTAEPSSGGRHVLIAAGSGITPVLSVASSLLAQSDAHVTLLYGNRRTNTVMFAEELGDLKDAHGSRLELMHVLSREPREVELFSGRLDGERVAALLDALVPVDAVDGFWLCGPYAMVLDVREVLAARGVGKDRIHQELFFAGEAPPAPVQHEEPRSDEPTSAVTVRLDGRSSTLALPRSQPVLDSAQRQRSDLPFACKGGVCGTCRAQVTDGEVDMRRNYALEDDEVDAGFVLTCQSYPVSDEVTVDYDA
ncbi:1,2-phenylacetyl-CoA epoxidase subunit PaaE [Solicola gregarius]|uniref:3-ketosteroid-9-alpha-monooxygenase, ferredoxin reductase component n=1 Tax=Solicola gregarius TaxID=2908642 RepID=A0AA46TJW9_9ACTN|nr:1,2-phenylacetyl-CoA epoxidase subunit PaaE [Solicola gregarius]UYM06483.1 phenylacetate-CoA oxygenase/reductase subunit PaaK [Solicola gregarius]